MTAPVTSTARPSESPRLLDLVVVGGCGHVGLPLALSFASVGARVGIYDTDAAKIAMVRRGEVPFVEKGAPELLAEMLASQRLEFSSDAEMISASDRIVTVIGTPIDEFMNPSVTLFDKVVDQIGPKLRPGAMLVLRSTVYPGTTEFVQSRLDAMGRRVTVVFCPERVAEGVALEEIKGLPQLIGALDDTAFERAGELFGMLGVEIVRTTPKEAELAKLLNNTWRYLKFAIANQFFEIADAAGIDYNAVLHAIKHHYPRGADVPGPGFAAGPCLLKDTMQLAAFAADHFPLGHSAMLINEGLPDYILDRLGARGLVAGRTLGILGMAFKGDSDDPRTSLSYKLRKLAVFRGARVLCTDPYIEDPRFLPLERVLAEADVLVIAAPHRAYRSLDLNGRQVVDIWNLQGGGIRV